MQLVFFSLLVAFGKVFFSTPQCKPNNADLIVILGGGVGARLKKGIELYRHEYSNKMFVTGFPEMDRDVLPTHSKWRIQYLIEQGIPKKSLILDDSAKNSYEEAVAVKKLMLENQWYKVLVVSDPPHLRRLSYIFSAVFETSNDLSFLLVASEPAWWAGNYWWSNTISAQFVLLEVVKLGYFFLTVRRAEIFPSNNVEFL